MEIYWHEFELWYTVSKYYMDLIRRTRRTRNVIYYDIYNFSYV